MEHFNREQQSEELMVKIGLHDGPCLAVTLNERLDYFGQTVNIAARVQGIAGTDSVLTTEPVIAREGVKRILDERRVVPTSSLRELKGIRGALNVYEIPALAR
jgi:class 3 adenylate cyclase